MAVLHLPRNRLSMHRWIRIASMIDTQTQAHPVFILKRSEEAFVPFSAMYVHGAFYEGCRSLGAYYACGASSEPYFLPYAFIRMRPRLHASVHLGPWLATLGTSFHDSRLCPVPLAFWFSDEHRVHTAPRVT